MAKLGINPPCFRHLGLQEYIAPLYSLLTQLYKICQIKRSGMTAKKLSLRVTRHLYSMPSTVGNKGLPGDHNSVLPRCWSK